MITRHPPPPISHLLLLISRRLALAIGIIALALGIGICGYHTFEGLSPLDSLLNAAMILGGMGPVTNPVTVGGKLFASFYALFSGILFLTVAAIVLGPVMHRILHRFHWEMGQDQQEPRQKASG